MWGRWEDPRVRGLKQGRGVGDSREPPGEERRGEEGVQLRRTLPLPLWS